MYSPDPRRRFDDIVGALSADDPRFATAIRPARPRWPRLIRRIGFVGATLAVEIPILIFYGWAPILGALAASIMVAWLLSAGDIARAVGLGHLPPDQRS
ncbi:DUF3040 domain-containing protein [Cryptosporangium japonicum]|uniref:DUF3040 domain-containing protein n=1 Tax=Cryptosporangium japonicum TaxID=80872 RepID=A0ABN0TFT7_9ACTN